MASLDFILPKPLQKTNERTLIKGFGLPIVQRAFLNTIAFEQGDTPESISTLGTPIYDSLFIEMPEYSVFEYVDETKQYVETDSGVTFVDEIGGVQGLLIQGCIITTSAVNNIVKTPTIGGNGTVKESIAKDDTSISINGFFATNVAEKYPFTQVGVLRSYCAAPVPLKITNTYLNRLHNIDTIVVENITMFQQQGFRNIQYFNIQAVSDYPFQIKPTNATS